MNQTVKQINTERYEEFFYSSRIVQVHPTLRCNLACKHCYSSSLPAYRNALNVSELNRFLQYAYDEGYNVVSVSGGEPFIYRDLQELFRFTKKIGFTNVVASNGMLLGSEKSKQILEYVDLIAVSIDGKSELHNKIRGSEKAFDKMLSGVEIIKTKNIPFGFIHTVTNESWDSLLWLGEFAQNNGAKLLQLHPLEMYGRAVSEMQEYSLDQTLLHKIFFLATYLKSKYEPEIFVQLDFLHREYIREFPQSVNVISSSTANKRLSEIINSIIIDENGDVLPVGYGFSKKYQIGSIRDANNIKNIFADFTSTKLNGLLALFEQAYDQIISNEEIDLVNWNELIIKMSND